MPRVSKGDLAMAIDWLENYEGMTPEESAPFLRVAEYLRAELERRNVEPVARAAAKRAGCSISQARAAARRALGYKDKGEPQ